MDDLTLEPRAFVAECFWPGVKDADIEAAEVRARRCAAALAKDGDPDTYLGSTLFPSDEVVFFEFSSASADVVRRASEKAAIPFARIVESVARSATPNSSVQEEFGS
jgi:hypothetical protein